MGYPPPIPLLSPGYPLVSPWLPWLSPGCRLVSLPGFPPRGYPPWFNPWATPPLPWLPSPPLGYPPGYPLAIPWATSLAIPWLSPGCPMATPRLAPQVLPPPSWCNPRATPPGYSPATPMGLSSQNNLTSLLRLKLKLITCQLYIP